MSIYQKLFIVLLGALSFTACKPLQPEEFDEKSIDEKSLAELDVPEGFLFATTHDLRLHVAAVDNQGEKLINIPFEMQWQEPGAALRVLGKGWIGPDGTFETLLSLPLAGGQLIIQPLFPGLPPATLSPQGIQETTVILGENNQVDDRQSHATERPKAPNEIVKDRNASFSYIGTFDGQGVPNYLESGGDLVSQDILNMIAASLPESQPVPTYHPEYIASGVQTNTVLTKIADVWVTFVHEGAGYRNAVGYYTYPTGQTPQSAANIGALNVVFPNCSYSGAGGGLNTGDKVYLGRFNPGTTIGWFLVPDGWASGSVAENPGYPMRYSDEQFNTFTSPQYDEHVVQLVDPNRELLLLGFEDLNRPGGDNDFNDAIFYLTVTPFVAVDRSGMEETNIPGSDTDNDGVPDQDDAAPSDPSWAFSTFTPAQGQFASLAFEDLFPAKGDYDMNDMIIDYNVEERYNTANKIVQLKLNFKLRAMGAGFRNGFGIDLGIPASKVEYVGGNEITDNYIQLLPSGAEANQASAVIIAFDNGYSLMQITDGLYVNTEPDKIQVPPYEFTVTVNIPTGVTKSQLGTAPYNPFIFINRERGREVHLPGKLPTQLVDNSLFQTQDDAGGTYLTTHNLPWAIQLPWAFQYPVEKTAINQAYLKFNQWAQSGGSAFTNWYQDNSGFRASDKIMQ